MMTKRLSTVLFVSLMAMLSFPLRSWATDPLALIPKPVSVVTGNGKFTFPTALNASYPAYEGDSVKSLITQFASDFKTTTGIRITATENASNATFTLSLNAALGPEAYTLSVTSDAIKITASHPIGFYYALLTLKQLMPRNVLAGVADKKITKWTLPVVAITDKPRFSWRGFMLDVGRHFFDKNEIKRVIDIMSVYKLNRFHWHLTEDQGWRIEIKKYPKLTSVGAWRNSKVLSYGSQHTDGIRYGGYYTQDDVKEIVAYAKQHFIEIVPELDMPGHCQAAMAAYPELSCTPNATHNVWTSMGVSGDVMNVANAKSIQFVKDVIDELIPLFPFQYFHVGGDECPTNAWQNNTECNALLTTLGSTNYRDLQTNFYKQIQTYLDAKPTTEQRHLISWNEILHGNTTGLNLTIMAWTGADGAAKTAATRGFDNVLTPQIPYYINRKQSADAGEPNTPGSGSETVKAVYAYQPANGIDASLLPHYKGVQASFWTEWVVDPSTLEYLILPRLAAVAEAGWTPQASRDYNDFVKRLREDSILYQLKGWNYGKHIFKVPVAGSPLKLTSNQVVSSLDSLATGDLVMFQNVNTGATNRQGYLHDDDGSQILTATSLPAALLDASHYVWKVIVNGSGTATTYSFQNCGTNYYIPNVTTASGTYSPSTTPGTFTIASNSSVSNSWSIKTTASGDNPYWNGEAGHIVSWSTAHPYKIWKVTTDDNFFYRIRSASTSNAVSRYLTATQTNALMGNEDKTSAAQIWQLPSNSAYTTATLRRTLNPYVLYSPATQAIFNSAKGELSESGTTSSAFYVHTISSSETGLMDGSSKYTAITADGTDSLTAGSITQAKVGGDASWTFEPAEELRVVLTACDSLAYATCCLPYSVTLPTGVTAYIAVKAANSSLYLQALTTSIVPASTPVILAANRAGTYFLVPSGLSAQQPTSNLLRGTTIESATIVENGAYLFDATNKTGELNLLTSGTIAAYKAYLPATVEDKVSTYTLRFEMPLGIQSATKTSSPSSAYYDLTGRIAKQLQHGIYITKGKKIIK